MRLAHYLLQPGLSVSSALSILLRYATHSSHLSVQHGSDRRLSAPTHSEQQWACPDFFCPYVALNNYQDLQRHYRQRTVPPILQQGWTDISRCRLRGDLPVLRQVPRARIAIRYAPQKMRRSQEERTESTK